MIIKNPTIIIKQEVVGQSEEVVIKLPEEFWEATDVLFTFKVSAEIYLFSSNDYNASGLWEYNVKTETSTKVYDGGYSYKYFKEVPNGVLISAWNSAYGLYFYDKVARTVTKIGGTGFGYDVFIMATDNEMLIKSSNASDILIYNIIDNSIISASGVGGMNSAKYYNLVKYDNGAIMAESNANSKQGIMRYNASEHSFTSVYDSGYSFQVYAYENEILYYNKTSPYQFLFYNVNTEEIAVLSENVDLALDWASNITKIGQNFLIPPRRPNQPVRLLNGETLTLSDIYNAFDATSTTVIASYVLKVNENTILLSSGFSGSGVLCYDNTTKTVTQIYDVGQGWNFSHIVGNKAFGYSNSSSFTDILSYDIDSNTITSIYSAGANVNVSKQIGSTILFFEMYKTSGIKYGVLMYDSSTEMITNPTKRTGFGNFVYEIDGDALISGSTANGLLLFDSDAMTVKTAFPNGRAWVFETDNNGNFVGTTTNQTASGNKKILFYDSQTKTIALKEYIVG